MRKDIEGGAPYAITDAGLVTFAATGPHADKPIRRAAALIRALPDTPLATYRERTKSMPTSTEVERIAKQRVGQDIFRASLDDYWFGRCPITGISDRVLLRASHTKPWADCETDEEDRGQLDRYVTWMRDERGFTPSTVEQWGRTTRKFLRWCAEAGRQLGDLTADDIDNYVATQGKAAGRASRQPTPSRHCERSCVTPGKRGGARTNWQSRFPGLGSISRSLCHMPRTGLPSSKCWPTSTRTSHGIFAIAPSFCCSASMACGAVKLLLCGSTRSIGQDEPSDSFG